MEIKSKKMPKTEKMQKMCILLGAIIIIIVLLFMPNGFISAINAIKMKQLSVWELMIMSFLSFVPMWIVIEDIVLGMISCSTSKVITNKPKKMRPGSCCPAQNVPHKILRFHRRMRFSPLPCRACFSVPGLKSAARLP